MAFTVDADDPAVVTVTVTDEAWLADPARVWPVRVDPTVYATGVTTDCQLQAAFPDLVDCSSDTGLVDDAHRLIFDFDLPGLLDEPVTIRQAGFELYRNQADPGSSTAILTAHRIDQDWDAGSVTWDDAQAGSPWTVAGGVAADSQEYATTVGSDVTWVNVGRLAQEWVNDEARTSGLVLATEPGSGYYRFDMSETAHLDRWPRLYVHYEPLIGVEEFYSFTRIDLDGGRTIDVNHASGNLTLTATDVDLSAATGVAGTGVTRTYNSRYLYGTAYHWQASEALGWQWQLTPHTGNRLYEMVPGGRTLLRDHRRVFNYDDGTAWHSPPFVAETLLRHGDQTWTATDPQAGTTWTYSPAGYPIGLDHVGQTGGLQFGYDPEGRMDLIADAQGQPLVGYTYRTDGAHTPVPIASLTDPSGGVHSYDVQGYELRSYTPPSGPVTTYDWDQVAITDITRADEHVAIVNDTDGRALQVTRTIPGQPAQTWTFDYTTPWQTTITHPDTTVETVEFDRAGRPAVDPPPPPSAPEVVGLSEVLRGSQTVVRWQQPQGTPPADHWLVVIDQAPSTVPAASDRVDLPERFASGLSPGQWWVHVDAVGVDGTVSPITHMTFEVAEIGLMSHYPGQAVWETAQLEFQVPPGDPVALVQQHVDGSDTVIADDVPVDQSGTAVVSWDTTTVSDGPISLQLARGHDLLLDGLRLTVANDSGPDLRIRTAHEQGLLTTVQAADLLAASVWDPSGLDSQYQTVEGTHEPTVDAAMIIGALSDQQRQQYAESLMPQPQPTQRQTAADCGAPPGAEAGTSYDPFIVINGSSLAWDCVVEGTTASPAFTVRVHYRTGTDPADDWTNAKFILDETLVAEEVYRDLGFTPLTGDLPIFTLPEIRAFSPGVVDLFGHDPAFILERLDERLDVIRHELFHQTQWRYRDTVDQFLQAPAQLGDLLWWYEATAEWAAWQVNEEHRGVGGGNYASGMARFFNRQERSLNDWSHDQYQYGVSVLPIYLTQRGGTGDVLGIFEQLRDEAGLNPLQAVADVAASDPGDFIEFTANLRMWAYTLNDTFRTTFDGAVPVPTDARPVPGGPPLADESWVELAGLIQPEDLLEPGIHTAITQPSGAAFYRLDPAEFGSPQTAQDPITVLPQEASHRYFAVGMDDHPDDRLVCDDAPFAELDFFNPLTITTDDCDYYVLLAVNDDTVIGTDKPPSQASIELTVPGYGNVSSIVNQCDTPHPLTPNCPTDQAVIWADYVIVEFDNPQNHDELTLHLRATHPDRRRISREVTVDGDAGAWKFAIPIGYDTRISVRDPDGQLVGETAATPGLLCYRGDPNPNCWVFFL